MDSKNKICFTLDGEPIWAVTGQTITEAIIASGRKILRVSKQGTPQGAFCGMGVCFGCRMIVDGIPNIRTCITPVTPDCKVQTQNEADFEEFSGGTHES